MMKHHRRIKNMVEASEVLGLFWIRVGKKERMPKNQTRSSSRIRAEHCSCLAIALAVIMHLMKPCLCSFSSSTAACHQSGCDLAVALLLWWCRACHTLLGDSHAIFILWCSSVPVRWGVLLATTKPWKSLRSSGACSGWSKMRIGWTRSLLVDAVRTQQWMKGQYRPRKQGWERLIARSGVWDTHAHRDRFSLSPLNSSCESTEILSGLHVSTDLETRPSRVHKR